MLGSIGTVIHGTMQPRDVIPALSDELSRLDEKKEYQSLIDECDNIDWDEEDNMDDNDKENLGWITECLFDALEQFAPDGCYFGAHEGDGSDYGFWPVPDEYRSDMDESI